MRTFAIFASCTSFRDRKIYCYFIYFWLAKIAKVFTISFGRYKRPLSWRVSAGIILLPTLATTSCARMGVPSAFRWGRFYRVVTTMMMVYFLCRTTHVHSAVSHVVYDFQG